MSERATWIGRGLGLLGLLLGMVVGARYLITDAPSDLFLGLGLTAILAIAAWVYLDWDMLSMLAGRRGTQRQAGSWTLVLLGLGITVLVNYLSYQHHWDRDVTEGAVHSLSQQTVDTLDALESDVQITGFYRQVDSTGEAYRLRDEFEQLVGRYEDASDHIAVELVDPDIDPTRTMDRGVFQNAVVFVACGEREERLIQPDENDLTNALIKVTRSGRKTIYVLSGHGEASIRDGEPTGLSTLQTRLSSSGFVVEELELYREGMVPADATVLVIAGPMTALLPAEVPLVRDFVERRGGGLLVMLEPERASGLEPMLRGWGIDVGDDLVVDLEGQAMVGDFSTVFADYGMHEITEDLAVPSILYHARSVSAAEDADGVTELLRSSSSAWAETDLESTEIAFDDGEDLRGPVPLGVVAMVPRVAGPTAGGDGGPHAGDDDDSATGGDARADGDDDSASTVAAVEEEALPDLLDDADAADDGAATTPVVVLGDVDVATNATMGMFGNGDLVLNTISYLAREEDLITIRAREEDDRPIQLTALQRGLVLVVAVPGMTMLVILAGVVAWIARLAR